MLPFKYLPCLQVQRVYLYSEPLSRIPSARILAFTLVPARSVPRAEHDGVVRLLVFRARPRHRPERGWPRRESRTRRAVDAVTRKAAPLRSAPVVPPAVCTIHGSPGGRGAQGEGGRGASASRGDDGGATVPGRPVGGERTPRLRHITAVYARASASWRLYVSYCNRRNYTFEGSNF